MKGILPSSSGLHTIHAGIQTQVVWEATTSKFQSLAVRSWLRRMGGKPWGVYTTLAG